MHIILNIGIANPALQEVATGQVPYIIDLLPKHSEECRVSDAVLKTFSSFSAAMAGAMRAERRAGGSSGMLASSVRPQRERQR
jgi:hypothetical protein